MELVKEISLDIYEQPIYQYVNAKQFDNISRILKITLKDGETVLTPKPAEESAVCRALKPDGTGVIDPATVEADGKIAVALTDQMLACAGKVTVDIALVSLANPSMIISTATFFIQVEPAPSGKKVESTNEFLVLVEATQKAQEATQEAKRVSEDVSKAEKLREQAEQGRVDAEAARKTAETNRGTAESARVAAEKDRAAREGERAAAEEKRSSAETTRQQQEQKRQTDTSKAVSDANAATKRANDAAAQVEGGLETLIITDDDDGKKWATKLYIRSGHLVMVSEEKIS